MAETPTSGTPQAPQGGLSVASYTIVLTALSLNLFVICLVPAIAYPPPLGWPLVGFVSFAAILLMFGIWWWPARASTRGISLWQSVNGCLGAGPTWVVRYLLMPVAVCVWFAATLHMLGLFLGVNPYLFRSLMDDVDTLRAMIIVALVGLAVMPLCGPAKGLGTSTLFLSKIALVSSLGLLVSYRDNIPHGMGRIGREFGLFEAMPLLGFLLAWFCVPLLALLPILHPQDARKMKLFVTGTLGIAIPLVVAVAIGAYLFVGGAGWLTRVDPAYGNFPFFQFGSRELSKGRVLVATLMALSCLRLGPYMLSLLFAPESAGMATRPGLRAPDTNRLVFYGVLVIGFAVYFAWTYYEWLSWAPYAVAPIVGLTGLLCGVGVASLGLKHGTAALPEEPGGPAAMWSFTASERFTFLVLWISVPFAIPLIRAAERVFWGMLAPLAEVGVRQTWAERAVTVYSALEWDEFLPGHSLSQDLESIFLVWAITAICTCAVAWGFRLRRKGVRSR